MSTVLAGFTGSTEVDLPIECTLRLRGRRRPSTSTRWRTARSRCVLLFSGTVFTRGTSGFAAEPVPWDREAAYRLPVARLARRHGPVLPRQRLGAGPSRHPRPAPAVQGRASAADVGPGDRAAPEAGRGSRHDRPSARRRSVRGGRCGGRRGALRGVRAVPVPGVGAEEPGALAVRRARPAGVQRARRLGALVDAHRVPRRRRTRPLRSPSASAACRPSTGRSEVAVDDRRRFVPTDVLRARRPAVRRVGRSRRPGRRPADDGVGHRSSGGARRDASRSPAATSWNRSTADARRRRRPARPAASAGRRGRVRVAASRPATARCVTAGRDGREHDRLGRRRRRRGGPSGRCPGPLADRRAHHAGRRRRRLRLPRSTRPTERRAPPRRLPQRRRVSRCSSGPTTSSCRRRSSSTTIPKWRPRARATSTTPPRSTRSWRCGCSP